MSTPTVLMTIENNIALIQLNDPATRNAMSEASAKELMARLSEAEQQARVVIITGAGKGFCSGAKLNNKKVIDTPSDLELGKAMHETYNVLMQVIRDLNVPVITAVNGAAAGLGFSLAASGDYIVAASSAKFVLAFSKIGLVPDGGITYQLVKSLGRAKAMELVLFDEKITPHQALEWKLINQVVEDDALINTAMEAASKLANGPTIAYAQTRKLIASACESTYTEQLAAEAEAQNLCGKTYDHINSVKAFLAKQTPVFTGN